MARDAKPGNQSAPTDRGDDRIEVRDLLQQLQRGGPLAGDNVGVVVRRNQGPACLRQDRGSGCLARPASARSSMTRPP